MINRIFVTIVPDNAKVFNTTLQVIPQKGERVFIKDAVYIVEAMTDHTLSFQYSADGLSDKHNIRVYLKFLQNIIE